MSATIHRDSACAYDETATERRNLEERIMALMADGTPRTDRQIMHKLGHPEMLRPRVTTLVAEGQLHEVGDTICEWTGKRVRLTRRFL